MKKYLIYASIVFSIYALLIGFRITTTHTGIITGDISEKSTILIGQPRPERSDEFLRGSPLVIAALRGIPADFKTPFELTNYIQSTKEISGLKRLNDVLMTPDALLNRILTEILPLEFAFTANWWSLTLLIFLALPAWFLLMGGRMAPAVACCISLLFVAPSAWFSYLPLQLIGMTAASLTYILLAFRLSQSKCNLKIRLFSVAIFGFFSAKHFVSVAQYPPWGFPIILVSFALTVGWMFEIPGRYKPFWVPALLAISGLAASLLMFFSNKSSYVAALETVYPGQRRSSGGGGETPFLGGSLSWLMQTSWSRIKGFTNPELAYGPTFLFVVVFVLCILSWPNRKKLSGVHGSSLAILMVAMIGVWGASTWPEIFIKFNPLVFIPGSRATMILGPISVLLVCHAVSTYANNANHEQKQSRYLGVSFLTAAMIAFFTAEDVEWLRNNYYVGAASWKGFVSIIFAALIGSSIILRIRKNVGLCLMTLSIVLSGILINPWTVGLGALNKSGAVTTLQELAKTDKAARWASPGFYLDALIMASAVPQSTGQQFLAPNRNEWHKLDPSENFIDAWNRGQSYVQIVFSPGGAFSIWNPSPDVIQIVGDPCDVRFKKINLGWYISGGVINSECLVLRTSINWMGGNQTLYQLSQNST